MKGNSLRINLMTAFLLLLFGLIGIFLQGAIVRLLIPGIIFPAFSITLVLYLAFFHASTAGVMLAFMLGLEYDLFSGSLLGPWAGSFVVIYAFFALLTPRMFVDSPLVSVLTGFLASLLASVVFSLIRFMAPGVITVSYLDGVYLHHVFYEAVGVAIMTPFVIAFLSRVFLNGEKRMTYAY